MRSADMMTGGDNVGGPASTASRAAVAASARAAVAASKMTAAATVETEGPEDAEGAEIPMSASRDTAGEGPVPSSRAKLAPGRSRPAAVAAAAAAARSWP